MYTLVLHQHTKKLHIQGFMYALDTSITHIKPSTLSTYPRAEFQLLIFNF